MSDYIHKTKCQVCGRSDLAEVLNLGEMPLANAFLREEDLEKPEKKFPLIVYFCDNCKLVQLLDVVNPNLLFRDYAYLTSTSPVLANHFIEMGHYLANRFIKSKGDLVMEIGGNDGVLLEAIKDRCRVLNIDPAENLTPLSEQRGVSTISEFFSKKQADLIKEKYGATRVIVANNVFAHIDDIHSVCEGIRTLIGKSGVFVSESHWVGNLIGDGGFDQIYHEHLRYYSLTAFKRLIERHGMKIFDVETVPIHGESLRIYVGTDQEVSDSVGIFLKKEKSLGLDQPETFLKFGDKVRKNKEELRDLLLKLKEENKKIAGYGAAAKGNTLLNYFQITSDIVDLITDSNPLKQGLYTPGTRIPVVAPERLLGSQPDYALLLAWNYADAIIAKETEFKNRGGKFIIPVPETRIV